MTDFVDADKEQSDESAAKDNRELYSMATTGANIAVVVATALPAAANPEHAFKLHDLFFLDNDWNAD